MSEIVHQTVSDFEIPPLAPYRNMRSQTERPASGIFVAEGEKVVRRLIESQLRVVSLVLPEKWLRVYEPILRTRPETQIDAFTADKSVLEKLVGLSMYQGVLAVGCIPTASSIDQLWNASRPQRPRLFLAVEGLSSGENLGGIVRTAAAMGVDGLMVGETCCHPYLRRSVRGSMGTVFKMPFHLSENLPDTLRKLGRRGCHIVGAHPHTDRLSLDQVDLRRDACIVMGSEGDGLTVAARDACHELAAIPMANEVDSLNVGNAAAVFLYEAFRQNALTTSGTHADSPLPRA